VRGRSLAAVSAICGVALVLVPAAAPHGPEAPGTGYIASVAGLDPLVLGVSVNVVGGDARLRLSNYSGKTVVVLGYRGEPFLRFGRNGVYENMRSPSVYLSRTRYPIASSVPPSASASSAARWRKIAPGSSYTWFDHRIHWTQKDPPPGVQKEPRRIQLIFRWRVPALADGKRFVVSGQLGFAPSPTQPGSGIPWLVGAVVLSSVLALAGLAALGLRARRPAGSGGPSESPG
jgi:hypothetical protein